MELFVRASGTSRFWTIGRTLRVRFLEGDPALQRRIQEYAEQWNEYASIRFAFVGDGPAEIRVAFTPGAASWSAVGTDALLIPIDEPTMNFGWLTPSSDETEVSRVVLHEFGHALGCIHEHQHPDNGIPWDRDAVYRYYGGPPNNWSREDVDRNIFQKYSRSITQFSQFDPTSIMEYPVPEELTLGNFHIDWNRVLSGTDQQYAGVLYPSNPQPAATELTVGGAPVQASIGAGGEVDRYRFIVPADGRYVIESQGPTDVVMTLYGPNSETALLAEDDDSGQARNARIVRRLQRGTYYVRIRHYRPTSTGAYAIVVRAQQPVGVGRAPETLADFEGTLVCPNGHPFPAAAGVCPRDLPPSAAAAAAEAGPEPEEALRDVPAVAVAFVDQFVAYVDNGKAPRSAYGFGYTKKIGLVNHIPVCRTLTQLTNYFNGGAATGSTHFGVGRESAGDLIWGGVAIPCAPVHQYMPIVGPYSPWAQGIIRRSAACAIPPSPTIAGMRSGEPNEAFVSVENVAMSGRDGVTEPQFNSNVMLRAYCAAYFGHAIDPLTQLWHSEIDQKDRCFDPGWSGDLEDAMQDAAKRLLRGDISGLRGTRPAADTAPSGAAQGAQIALIEKVLRQDWSALQADVARLALAEDAGVEVKVSVGD